MFLQMIKRLFGVCDANDRIFCLDLGDYLCTAMQTETVTIKGMGPSLRLGVSRRSVKKIRGRFVLIPELEPNPHIVICGMSGFGKSTMFGAILRGAARSGIACTVFDAHDEHAETVRELNGSVYHSISERINLLSLDGATVSERISILSSLFKRVYNLGYIQSTKLSECLWYTYRRFGARSYSDRRLDREPRIHDLIYEINVFIRNSRTASERNGLLHLRDRLSILNVPGTVNTLDLAKLRTGVHSFSLSGMKSREERTIYLEELLGRLYGQMKDGRKERSLRQYIMIDEAQFIISSSESDMITRFIEEGRKYGVGVVIATHSSVKLNRQVVANASTFVSFYSREPTEAAFVSKVMGGAYDGNAVQSMISGLGVHEAVVFSSRKRSASKVSMKRVLLQRPGNFPNDMDRAMRLSVRPVRKEALVSAHNISPELVDLMVDSGALQSFDCFGEQWVSSKKSNPGIEHEVMVEKMHALLSGDRIKNYIYDRAGGPDIVAFTRAGKIAIEYETGTKNIDESRAMIIGRLREYARVVVVAKYANRYAQLGTERIKVIPAMSLNEICNACQ